MNKDLKIIFKKKKKLYEVLYPNLEVAYEKDINGISFHVENKLGKFSKGFMVKEDENSEKILKRFEIMEKLLLRTAMYYFFRYKNE